MGGLYRGRRRDDRGPALHYTACNVTRSETEISYYGNKCFVCGFTYAGHKKNRCEVAGTGTRLCYVERGADIDFMKIAGFLLLLAGWLLVLAAVALLRAAAPQAAFVLT